MAVTMEDIAQAAGVHRATVSRALADSPRIKLETRSKIQHLAEEMGYVPNAAARGLITRRSYALGAVVLELADPYPAESVDAIDEAAQKVGYRIVLSRRSRDAGQVLTNIKGLIEQRVEAVIVIESTFVDEYLSLLSKYSIPVILLHLATHPHCVGTDNVPAARLGVEHLLDLGHERIAFIGSSRGGVESGSRQAGYEQALRNRGIAPDPGLITIYDDWLTPEGGRASMRKLMSQPQSPTAVFCWNDRTAIGALREASAAGLQVPQDVSVVGFDDIGLTAYLNPPLTTVAQQKERLAELAVEMALSLIVGDTPGQPEGLPGKLIVRGSTAPPGNSRQ